MNRRKPPSRRQRSAAHNRTPPKLRLALVRAALVLAFLGLAARAAHLSLIDERGLALGERQQYTILTLAPERGAIVDRNGHEFALSLGAPSVYAIPTELNDVRSTARRLAPVLGQSTSSLAKRLEGRRNFVFLSRWVTPERAAKVRQLGLHGIGIVEEPRRIYPYRTLAASLIGFANIDGRGVRGIEQQEDDWLRGTPLRLPVERDGSGQLLLDTGNERWSTAGGDVALTLDAAMQSVASRELKSAIERTGAKGGVVVTMNPATGEILALAETPTFDPNRFRELRYSETRSRAFLDASEPGSTLKIFLIAAALESGAISADESFDCEEGFFPIPGKVIRDHHAYGKLNTADILRVSSNIGAVKIATALGPQLHVKMLRRFGFGKSSGSGFPDESAGLLRVPKRNRPVDHATLAFGQGMSVTPIQLAAATSAIANGGLLMQPRLVNARRAPGESWRPTRPELVHRVVSERTAETVLTMMEAVVGPTGTGRRAALRGVRVAGKTGTAQKFDPVAGHYSDDNYVAWFIGVAPADAPRIVIVAALDEPRRPNHTGGSAAAPLFASVAAAQLARFGILTEPIRAPQRSAPFPTTRTASAAAVSKPEAHRRRSATKTVPPGPAKTAMKKPPAPLATPSSVDRELVSLDGRLLLPDLRGLTVAEVQAVARSAGIAVIIEGKGRAVSQEPPPGTIVVTRSARIRVRFEPATAELARSQLPREIGRRAAPGAEWTGGDSI